MSKLSEAPTAYTFDDFFLAPVHSKVKSRKAPDVSMSVGKINLDIPIVASPMNTVTEEDMLVTMISLGGAAVLHRYLSLEDQINIATNATKRLEELDVTDFKNRLFIAVGASGDFLERTARLYEAGFSSFCVDIANGHSELGLKATEAIRGRIPSSTIMAGNVCTFDGALKLAEAGADVLRVGIGGGAVCVTRIVTGHGVPQLSAIEDCAKIKYRQNIGYNSIAGTCEFSTAFSDVVILADGGLRTSGDITKALAIGADAVMLGSILAGTKSTPGETHKDPDTGFLYKYYNGMASTAGRDGWFGREETSFVPEGESTKIPYKGDTSKVVDSILGGLRVGMSYAGSLSLEELRKNASWRRVTQSGMAEAAPHGKR